MDSTKQKAEDFVSQCWRSAFIADEGQPMKYWSDLEGKFLDEYLNALFKVWKNVNEKTS